jgi:(2Fe-2S) ferredoxin
MKYLFIGGCADGKKLEVYPEGIPKWRVAVPRRATFTPADTMVDNAIAEDIRVHEYVVSDWHVGPERKDVKTLYVLSGMSPEDVWETLVRGYLNFKGV